MDRSVTADANGLAGRIVSDGVARTRALGHALGAAATPGTLIALTGPLGAGKTQVAKGVATGLGIVGVVNSPTFVLMNEHPGRLRLYHVDAYRLDDPADALAAGLLDERGADGVTVIEWAERLDGWLPDERIDIVITPDRARPDRRELRWSARGTAHAALARSALDDGAAR